jgi:branched-chain amino acid transport system ATP-binding protein
MRSILEVKDATMDFGGIRALDSLDMGVNEREIVALIGPNGAGKTTFFNCLTGLCRPARGDLYIMPPDSEERIRLNHLKPNRVTEYGLARTFQNIRLFKNMTVLENVMIGCHPRSRAGIGAAILRSERQRKEEEEIVEKSYGILKTMGLEMHANDLAKNLPYGSQRCLEIARALATGPFLLLLDEPAAGMNPRETSVLDNLIKEIREKERISILLIEHDMKLVMSLSDRIIVLDYGKKIAEGPPEEIRRNPSVIEAYLGEEADA